VLPSDCDNKRQPRIQMFTVLVVIFRLSAVVTVAYGHFIRTHLPEYPKFVAELSMTSITLSEILTFPVSVAMLLFLVVRRCHIHLRTSPLELAVVENFYFATRFTIIGLLALRPFGHIT